MFNHLKMKKMKNLKFKTLTLLLAMALLSINTSIFAQNGQNMKMGNKAMCNIPNLTQDQQTKIEKLKTVHMREMISFKTQLAEKKAHKNTLMTAKTIDLKAVNKVIDEMSSIKTQMQKNNAKRHNDVRNLLTDEQKVFFDNHYLQMKKHGMRQGMRKGMMGRQGNGMRGCRGNMQRQGQGMNK